jgi:excisionase family DNA binding protein
MRENNFLTTAEAAEFMGVRRTTIYSLIKRKAMAYYKPMGRQRPHVSEKR